MVPDLTRTLPIRVRPHHFEKPENYGRRLALANGLPEAAARTASRQLATTGTKKELREGLHRWLESKGGLLAGHFERQELQAHTGIAGRNLCRKCAHGDAVEQIAHIESNCCLRHQIWTGPGTSPAKQVKVSREVLAAERRYRYLLSRGRIDLPLIRELANILNRDARPSFDLANLVAQTYPATVALADLLTNRCFHRSLFDPRRTFAESHKILSERIQEALPGSDGRIVDDIWLLVRPTFLLSRRLAFSTPIGIDFTPPVRINPADIRHTGSIMRPLEPFRRFLAQVRTYSLDSCDQRWKLYVVGGQREELIQRAGGVHLDLICKYGHSFRRDWGKSLGALDEGRSLCPVCNGGQILPGYNSLAETHPKLAYEWDSELNATGTPSTTGAGSNQKYAWKCSHGHSFEALMTNRALNGSGCPVCANFTLLSGFNDLATTHPDLAGEWHSELNGGLRPQEVISGRTNKFAWQCPIGHDYWKTIQKRKMGQGCPVCSGRKVVRGINDLGTTHPSLVAEWHPVLNALVPTEVSAGSEAQIQWLCPARHCYGAMVVNRTGLKRAGCPYCSKRKLLKGFNDLATQYPALAKDWHPEANGDLTSSEVLPGSGLRWWKCPYGHEQQMMFRNRLRAGGCTLCPYGERAAAA